MYHLLETHSMMLLAKLNFNVMSMSQITLFLLFLLIRPTRDLTNAIDVYCWLKHQF